MFKNTKEDGEAPGIGGTVEHTPVAADSEGMGAVAKDLNAEDGADDLAAASLPVATGPAGRAEPVTTKGEQTRGQIFQAALELFREKGFEATTMVEVAERAGAAKGAAYYYFPGKEAIIQAYYEAVQGEQERRCAEEFAKTRDLRERLRTAMHTKFDLARNDRRLLGVVFRYTGEPEHPLSCLGRGTAAIRGRSIAVFARAIEEEGLAADLKELLPLALWALQMGLLVMFLYDESEGQRRTRRLTDGALDLTMQMLKLAKLPVFKPVRAKILALLKEAQLV